MGGSLSTKRASYKRFCSEGFWLYHTIYTHPTASQYVVGMAFHWYDLERYMDGVAYHERLNDTHFVDPSRFLLATESCNCPGVAQGERAWFRALWYGHDIPTDLNNHVAGWVDGNLLLNHEGGPNHERNQCDAPLLLTEDGTDFVIQPMCYFIQHFSKYIPPGSRRVKTHLAARFATPGEAQLLRRTRRTRHTLHRTTDGKIQVTGTNFCLSLVDVEWQGHEIPMVECTFTSQNWTFEDETGRIRADKFCLSLNHASTENNVRITARPCKLSLEPSQQWTFQVHDGTLRSRASETDQCVTAGYAFIQATAFVTPADRHVLLVLNENTQGADFAIHVGDKVVDTTIPARAIRTYTWL
ncbi:hypothetical protein PsorP6_015767 [Peronosclerospora sorghi]|uniref:Uncharacterized protein n=1 Tax=Peronosclerospora sorghi TaxID=230839 RepID=A0ACC0WP44_9STRA|nr:hypothetical protein PsorP6_015767 [Peronosclerospora sorghi]